MGSFFVVAEGDKIFEREQSDTRPHPPTGTILEVVAPPLMCEFCNEPGHRRDYLDPSFAGFFSSDAIEACIKAVVVVTNKQNDVSDDHGGVDDDSDGT